MTHRDKPVGADADAAAADAHAARADAGAARADTDAAEARANADGSHADSTEAHADATEAHADATEAHADEVESTRHGDRSPGERPAGGEQLEDRHELPYTAELKRKSVHLVALIIPLAIWSLGHTPALVLLLVFSALALAADLLRVRSHAFARHLYGLVGFMMRPEECPAIGSPVVLNGATWVLLSATLLLIVFPVDIAILAFTAFMVGDAAAAVVGRRWGRRRWRGTTRTAEGSAAFLTMSVLVMLPFGWIPILVAVLASLAGAAAEIPYRPFNDNIRVPLVMGAVIYLARFITG